MARIITKENSFEGSPGGVGTMNYSVGWGTPGGGNVSQSPDKFKSSNSGTQNAGQYKDNIEETGSRMPERPDRKSSSGAPIKQGVMSDKGDFEDSSPKGDPTRPNTVSGDGTPLNQGESDNTEEYYPNGNPIETPDSKKGEPPGREGGVSPGGIYQNSAADKPINPDNAFDGDVDQMFKKKITPTPDELLSALQYEMNQMVKKDKYIAKSIVLKNLKEDPKYYSRLDMLNIDDDKMKVDESTVSKTKAVLDKMISDRQKTKPVIKNAGEIDNIFKDLWSKRHGFPGRK